MKLPDPKRWFLASLSSLLSPWHDAISKIRLISDYYQPELKLAASIGGVMCATVVLAAWERHSKAKNRVRLIWFSGLFLVALLGCYLLTISVGVFWHPNYFLEVTLRFIWPTLFFLLYIFASACISLCLLIFWK
ncbi:hypothetical protein [Sedimentitalea todarodis]|uniref:Uncharacterized protein n=1 Tax=Sedimentitalea todarodis TaxID=1631240 RepID=A0ABU3VLA5_9RHOB|nr:hypothetical protein [Sedimentitalea todarodis]MDU9006963.1 hypothetical protein [Sedimentitalea todarodis]